MAYNAPAAAVTSIFHCCGKPVRWHYRLTPSDDGATAVHDLPVHYRIHLKLTHPAEYAELYGDAED